MTAAILAITRIRALVPVTALASTRVYNVNWPQSVTLPSVRVNLITDPESYHLRGRSGVRQHEVQVDTTALTKAASDALMDAVHGNGLGGDATGMDGFAGTVAGYAISFIRAIGSSMASEYQAGDLKQYMNTRRYLVLWRDQ